MNKKNRPGGSGTTSANRRAMRAGLQWSNLEGGDPGSVECLERHEAALAAALEKTRAKKALEEERLRLEAEELAKEEALEKACAKKARALEKAEAKAKAKGARKRTASRRRIVQKAERARSAEPKGTPAVASEQGDLQGRLDIAWKSEWARWGPGRGASL